MKNNVLEHLASNLEQTGTGKGAVYKGGFLRNNSSALAHIREKSICMYFSFVMSGPTTQRVDCRKLLRPSLLFREIVNLSYYF